MKSKKGKKAWKKIDTTDVDDFLEKSTREERQGLAFEGVPDVDLFFVDKGPESEPAAPAAAGAATDGKKGKKLTRAQAILLAAHNAKPVTNDAPRKRKGTLPARGQKRAAPDAPPAAARKARRGRAGLPEAFDLWAEEPVLAAGAAALAAPPAAGGNALAGAGAAGSKAGKRQRVERAAGAGGSSEAARRAVRAVEIDLPGCSYNPDKEQHQDAVAVAVAAEMQKVYRKDLEPVAPPLLVDYEPESDELAMLQVVEEEGEEEEEGADGEGAEGEQGAVCRQQKAGARKTKKDRNREKRKREVDAELAGRRRLKAQRRELDRLPALEQEVVEQLGEQEAARMRKQVDKAERLADEPPKLGKQRFEPQPLQVLTSDEITGSLRRLKPTAMLTKDRFKSLQKRGIIEPRRKVAKKVGKKVVYEQGAKWDREKEGQQQINDARKRLKKKKKQ